MKTVLKGKPFKNGTDTQEYNQDFATDHLVESVESVDRNGIKGTVTNIQLHEVMLSMKEVSVEEAYEVEVKHDFSLIKMHFEIEGSNHYTPNPSTNGTSISIPQGHYNFFYLPEVNGTLSFDTTKRKTLEIQFTDAYVKRVLGNNLKEASVKFFNALNSKRPFVMWEKGAPIPVELREYIDAIYNCRFHRNIKKVYLEAKVMELLVVLLAKIKHKDEGGEDRLSKKEFEKMMEVGAYIEDNLEQPLTISDLANHFGTNTSKLKQQFKIVFNTTIFKYMTDVRMKHAKALIQSNDNSVSEAAYQVGYKNSQHFTVAFKKTYGYLPSQLRA